MAWRTDELMAQLMAQLGEMHDEYTQATKEASRHREGVLRMEQREQDLRDQADTFAQDAIEKCIKKKRCPFEQVCGKCFKKRVPMYDCDHQ